MTGTGFSGHNPLSYINFLVSSQTDDEEAAQEEEEEALRLQREQAAALRPEDYDDSHLFLNADGGAGGEDSSSSDEEEGAEPSMEAAAAAHVNLLVYSTAKEGGGAATGPAPPITDLPVIGVCSRHMRSCCCLDKHPVPNMRVHCAIVSVAGWRHEGETDCARPPYQHRQGSCTGGASSTAQSASVAVPPALRRVQHAESVHRMSVTAPAVKR